MGLRGRQPWRRLGRLSRHPLSRLPLPSISSNVPCYKQLRLPANEDQSQDGRWYLCPQRPRRHAVLAIFSQMVTATGAPLCVTRNQYAWSCEIRHPKLGIPPSSCVLMNLDHIKVQRQWSLTKAILTNLSYCSEAPLAIPQRSARRPPSATRHCYLLSLLVAKCLMHRFHLLCNSRHVGSMLGAAHHSLHSICIECCCTTMV